ncbi:hypothetical protein CWI36_0023p0040 [Hamiltosporidium magnivora]|uniref:Uncharacterized protein n=1 Tax=Hamiltosporidium magnivora TaxID=148818 RepID=A0A4Q9LME4_9MICR|nr:hypothetical protein CWI36_0023p0040 [Hamiltosporidium magnivora]
MSENYFSTNFKGDFNKKSLYVICDTAEYHGIDVVNNNPNYIFPDKISPTNNRFLKDSFKQCGKGAIYLSFDLRIENLMFIFGKKLLDVVGKNNFIEIINTDLPTDNAKRKTLTNNVFIKINTTGEKFCYEIQRFLLFFKSHIKSETYILFYMYRVQDNDWTNISKELISKHLTNKLSSKNIEPGIFLTKLK